MILSNWIDIPEEALRLYEDNADTDHAFNLCPVDWQMPGLNGIDTVKGIRDRAETNVPIIVITAYDYAEIVDTATAARRLTCLKNRLRVHIVRF